MQKRFIKSSYILGALALVWASAMVLLYLTYVRPNLMRQTEKIEQDVADEWFRLTEHFIRTRRNEIFRFTEHATEHTGLIRYVETGRENLLEGELPVAFLEQSRITMVILDDRKRVLSAWSAGGGRLVKPPQFPAGDDLGKLALFRDRPKAGNICGISDTPLGLAGFARCVVRRPDGGKPVGYIVSLQPMDSLVIEELSAMVGADVRLQFIPELPLGAAVSGHGHVVWQKDENLLKAAQPIFDSTGVQVGYLVVEGKAELAYRQAHTLDRAFVATLVLGILFNALVVLVIHKFISGPTARLLKRIERLQAGGKAGDLSVSLRGEARALARQFDDVLSRVEKLSETDSLTGLCNRRSFRQTFLREIHRSRRNGQPLTLAIMDIDFLKAANDVLGHQAGDRLLKIFTEVITRNVRATDTVARLGGDEFAVLMPETTTDEAAAVAERIRACLAEETIGEGELKMSLTASVGIVDMKPDAMETPDDLVDLGDQALYAAKRAGRNQIVRTDQLKSATGKQKSAKDRNKTASLSAQLAGLDGRLKHLFIEAIRGLTSALEARNEYSVNHSAKVCRYAMAIARQMQLPEHTVQHAGQAAVLHDIGRISLPDSVLLKKTGLTDDEMRLVRQHPVISAQIMEGMGFLDQEIPAVRYHHERYDGAGYPDGLSGSFIPLGARILAVADAFDAMTSSRPYRDSMPIDKALDEIRRCAGTQFDPVIVKAFLEAAESGSIAGEPVAEPLGRTA